MAFRPAACVVRLPVLVACLLGVGCAAQPGPFPLAPPLWVDPDQHPFEQRPEEYYSPFAWDAADQTVFRRLSRAFAVDTPGESVNVNALDEVPNSSWFHNRIGPRRLSPEQVARGPCSTPPLDPRGPWVVTGAKPNGANPGFIVRGSDGRTYLLKFDGTLQGPRATAADAVGARIYHAAGYYTPCNRIVYFERSILQIAPDASSEDERGNQRPLVAADVEEVLSKALRLRDGRYRASSSLFVAGEPLGPWRYQGTRDDDANDVVPHEDRRELRAMRVLAAWIHHFDSREQNTLATWIPTDDGRGYVRHHVLDFGDSFGSLWQPVMLGRRLGHAYYLDFKQLSLDWISLGFIERPWENARYGPTGRVFGYFDVEGFEPDAYKTGYPNPAFVRMQERDAAWMARIIARFSDVHLRALIATADLRDQLLSRELFRVLSGRRQRILNRYLTVLSPLSWPMLQSKAGRTQLCLEDLLTTSGMVSWEQRRYRYRAWLGEPLEPHEIDAGESERRGWACAELPKVFGAERQPAYLIVDVWASTHAAGRQLPARVHLYQLGKTRYQIVGLERPEQDRAPQL